MDVDAAVARARDAAADGVDDAEHAPALALHLVHRRQRVGGLARLADRDVEAVLLDHRIAIAELRRRLGVGRHARERLDQVRAADARVVRRAAAEDLDALDVEQVARAQVQTAEVRGAELQVETALQRPLARLGLLEDLLEHEVLVRAAVVRLVAPLHGVRALVGRPIVERAGLVAAGVDHGDLAVVEIDDLLGVAHQRRDVGGDEHLALADADHHRAAVARRDDAVGLARVEHRDAVRPVDRHQRLAHRLVELAADRLDEMRQHLAVGLGAKDVPLRLQLGAQRRARSR